jgi:hypothetical protein
MGGREFIYDTTRLQRPTISTFQDNDRLRLVMMSGLRRSWILGGPERLLDHVVIDANGLID